MVSNFQAFSLSSTAKPAILILPHFAMTVTVAGDFREIDGVYTRQRLF